MFFWAVIVVLSCMIVCFLLVIENAKTFDRLKGQSRAEAVWGAVTNAWSDDGDNVEGDGEKNSK